MQEKGWKIRRIVSIIIFKEQKNTLNKKATTLVAFLILSERENTLLMCYVSYTSLRFLAFGIYEVSIVF